MSKVSRDFFKQENCQERNSVCQRSTQPHFFLLTSPFKVPCELLLLEKPLQIFEPPAMCATFVLQQMHWSPSQTERVLRICFVHIFRANHGSIDSHTGFLPAVGSLLFSSRTVILHRGHWLAHLKVNVLFNLIA